METADGADDAGAVGLWGTWTLTLIVIALIGIPGDEATVGFSVLAFGGPALFLFAQVLIYGLLGQVPRSRPLGIAALALLAAVTASLSLIIGIAASTAVLAAVAISDTVREGGPAPRRSS